MLEILLSQPLLPQLLPRQSPAQPPQQPCSVSRMTKDTGKMEHGAQQATVSGFLHVNCTRIPEQEGTLSFQADHGVNPQTITLQVTAREEIARLLKSRQQRGGFAWNIEQSKQFDTSGCFCRGSGCYVCCILCAAFCCCFLCHFSLFFQ